MLRQNVSALDNPQRVQIFDNALGNAAGTLHFDLGPEEQSGWGGLANSASARSMQVKVCRLDDLIPPDKTVSVLKIDTEGADTWVLMGAENLLRQKRIQHIFYEANLERMQRLGIQPGEAEKYLTGLDYKVRSFGSQEFCATPE